MRLASVSVEPNSEEGRPSVSADHLTDRDRLADRAGKAQDHAGHEARADLGDGHAAHHLPPGRPQRQRSLLEIARDAVEELTADAGHDRHDHDRQNEGCGEQADVGGRPGERRDEPKVLVQEGLDVRLQKRPHHEDAPQPEDDARDGRQQLDQRSHGCPQRARSELAQKEPDGDRHGHGDDERDQRRHQRAPDQVESAVLVGDGVPLARGEEPEPERRDRRPRLIDHLVGDHHEDDDDGDRRRAGDHAKREIAGVEFRPAAKRKLGGDMRAAQLNIPFPGGRAPASRWEVVTPAPLQPLGDLGDLLLVGRNNRRGQFREPEWGPERLAVGDGIGQECLQGGGIGRRHGHDRVGVRGHRIRTRRRGGRVHQRDRAVGVDGRHGGRSRLDARDTRHRVLAGRVLDQRGIQGVRSDVGQRHVADRAVGALDRGCDTRVLGGSGADRERRLGRGADLALERRADRRQVAREDEAVTGAIAAVDRRDLRRGQVGAGIERLDLGIVPGRDRSQVDVGDHGPGQVQDPNDGGVYHKCTNAAFDKMVMPDEATSKRYVVQKSTAATLDFAAVAAQAARIFSKYKKQLPNLSDSCLKAAEYAWQWAEKNPFVLYNQNEMNKHFEPKITTGDYGDYKVDDEFFWAACELYASTKNEDYYKAIADKQPAKFLLPSWNNMYALGFYTLIRKEKNLLQHKTDIENFKKKLLAFADSIFQNAGTNAFATVMGGSNRDFNWGSNSNAANQSIALINAYFITQNKKYLSAALTNLDYILGRNATGYCFVTGIGTKSTMHPHHRPSVADGIDEPVPGLIAGGANPGRQDGCHYDFTEPETSYVDSDCAYASNEIAINWNAPLVYVANAIEALQHQLNNY